MKKICCCTWLQFSWELPIPGGRALCASQTVDTYCKTDLILFCSVICLSYQSVFFNALSHTKILNTEKRRAALSSFACFHLLHTSASLISLSFVLSRALHHTSSLQQIQQLLLFHLQLSSHTLSEACDKPFPHHAFSAALENIYI